MYSHIDQELYDQAAFLERQVNSLVISHVIIYKTSITL